MNSRQPVDASFFIRSFLVVSCHYVLLFVLLLIAMKGLAWLAFPEVDALWSEPDREKFDRAWHSSPEQFWPTGLCIGLSVISSIVSFLIGFQVSWFAPFSKSGHGVFLAIVCIVTILQITMTQPGIPKAMLFAMLLTTPTLIVYGARLGEAMSVGKASIEESRQEDDVK